jgi:hypothetical protein
MPGKTGRGEEKKVRGEKSGGNGEEEGGRGEEGSEREGLLFIALCLLPTVHCPLPTLYCSLHNVYCPLSTANWPLSISCHPLATLLCWAVGENRIADQSLYLIQPKPYHHRNVAPPVPILHPFSCLNSIYLYPSSVFRFLHHLGQYHSYSSPPQHHCGQLRIYCIFRQAPLYHTF